MSSRKSKGLIVGLSLLAFAVVIAGGISCKKAQEATKPGEQAAPAATNEFEGTVKVALGKYLYLPTAQGLDIVVQGKVGSGDATSLTGKEIRVKGQISKDKASIYIANSIDVKEGGQWRTVFTRTEEPVLNDFLDTKDRYNYAALTITNFNKPEEWEGKGKVRIFGKLLKATVTEGGAQKDITYVVLSDDKGKEIGKIIVDSFTDYTQYCLQKLRLFDKFWFYLDIKDTVDKKVRAKSHELFHADVFFIGLF
jgi:hypothetical protein